MGFCLLFCSNLNLGIYFKSLENLLPGSGLCSAGMTHFIFTFSACSPEQEERTLRKNIAREQQLLACLSHSVTFSKQSSKVSSSVKCNPTSCPDGSQVRSVKAISIKAR